MSGQRGRQQSRQFRLAKGNVYRIVIVIVVVVVSRVTAAADSKFTALDSQLVDANAQTGD
jgi:hypothetical protein